MLIGGIISIKEGKHEGESGVITYINPFNGVLEVLTLEGDYHYFGQDGKEVCPNCQGTKIVITMWGVHACQFCL